MLKHENIRRTTNAQTQVHRLEYEREVENKQKIKEAEKQADRVAFQSIDWHDFVVVETIEFKEGVVTTDMTSTAAAEQGDEEEEKIPMWTWIWTRMMRMRRWKSRRQRHSRR